MKNIISYYIDLSNTPNDVKKTFYFDDEMMSKNIKTNENNEKLINISKDDQFIKISPFWEDLDNQFHIEDKDLQYIIDLEWKVMKDYVLKHKDFWIKLRLSVYNKLKDVNDFFKKDWFEIVIKAWFRPLEVQNILFWEIFNYNKNKFPNKNQDEIYKETLEFIADWNNFVAPHTTGGAIDMILVETKTQKEVDMWSPINYPWIESYITFNDLTKKQLQNRQYFLDTMIKFWFANLASEWWHFSYWDHIWAMFYWKKETLYDKI